MKEPWFWRESGLAARAAAMTLAPAALLYDAGQRMRAAMTRAAKVSAPIICVGNATLGGVGKTPFALMLQCLLREQGVNAQFLSRGYGGSLKGPVRVTDRHTARDVGDEALQLAAAAPTYIAKSRVKGARAAAQAGAGAIIMDDGFQNREIWKDLSFLLLDAADPAGNARVFPAGPLREPLRRAIARADAIVLVGEGAPAIDAGERPLFRAKGAIAPSIAPQKIIAFCGIGGPMRFFASLEAAGFALAARVAFPDHHVYRPAELVRLKAQAKKSGAALITTEKDIVRLSADEREGVAVARLLMTADEPRRLTDFTRQSIGRSK